MPVISHYHDSNPADAILRGLHRVSAGRDARALAISAAVARHAVSVLGARADRTSILHNGIDTGRIEAASSGDGAAVRVELGIPMQAPVVAVIGRFSPEKGHEPFIRGLPGLLASRAELRVLLVGDGPRRLACEQLVDELGLRHAVLFAGFRNDIPAVLQAVDVVAIPSLEEGLSYTAMEAMAAGRPLVATAVGGLPEIIRDREAGLLTPPGDMPGLNRAIEEILADPGLAARLVAGGRAAVERLSVNAHAHELIREYNLALAGQGMS